ncbi:patatin-like phospholipase family protein [Natranaerofaba carboxydovora]|uniref:patatin-like phospholipase family protein n=1 Tax=Natranaerofaba carboxydovora TaxID=2742683 RepID=UPI001F136C9C|nr:patatin-like phospholipase family protein [Natranaerofaba carboxydovora]UMZ73315.1 putative NTE family protein [Natranaerofaba carboxydovora]
MDEKIGLALGSGAARGFAHIGVIKFLEREQIPIHCITGCSMGSLIGGLYARGMDIDMIEALACGLNHRKWMDVGVPRKGLLRGKKILDVLKLITKNYKIEELEIPFACIATDVQNGIEIPFTRGSLAEAIRASTSIPGIFVPYEDENERVLVDGAVVNRVPINLCRELGASKVIAVDVDFKVEDAKVNNIFDVIIQSMSIMQKEIMSYKINDCDLLIQPDLSVIKPGQFDRVQEAIDIGEKACMEMIEEIRAL